MRFASFVLLVALARTVVLAAGTTSASIAVDTTRTVRVVDERHFGINAVLWDYATNTPQTIALAQAAGLRFVRIPGGSMSDTFHWADGTDMYNAPYVWYPGIEGFHQLIAGLNCPAVVTVNYGSGTPEEAAAWVAYANARADLRTVGPDVTIGVDSNGTNWRTAGYWSALRAATPLATDDGYNRLRAQRVAPMGIHFWEIGNECYGVPWQTDLQVVRHDPYTYAVRARSYIAKMKAVDPTIAIGVVGVAGEDAWSNNTNHPARNPRTGITHNGWTPVLLTTLRSLGVTPDFLINHRYENQNGDPGANLPALSDAALLQSAGTWPAEATGLRQQLTDYLGTAGAGVEMLITESNASAGFNRQLSSLVNGLFYADSFGHLVQTEFNAFCWWDLRNGSVADTDTSKYGWRTYGDFGILGYPDADNRSEGYPTYYTMKLVSRFARGGDTVVRATSSDNLLSAFAVQQSDGDLALLVVNKSPDTTFNASFSLIGFAPQSAATVYSYGITQDEAARTGTGSPDITSSSSTGIAPTFTASFAPYSATVLILAAGAPVISNQPASQSVAAGANVTFSVTANGAAPLAYQWSRNGAAIAGATTNQLSLPHAGAADAGSYTVTVSNSQGSATSQPATLTVTSGTGGGGSQGGGGGGGGGDSWILGLLALLAAVQIRAGWKAKSPSIARSTRSESVPRPSEPA